MVAQKEVPEGYKQTEVGVIPEDWKVGEIGEVVSSTQLGGNYPNNINISKYPLIKMGNIKRSYIDINKLEYVKDGYIPNLIDQIKYGDVLFNTRNTLELVGKTAIWKNELPLAFYNSNLMRFVFDQNYIASNAFFCFMMNTKKIINNLYNIAIGTTSVAAIYNKDLFKLKIPLPPLPEQKAIAQVLSDTDALVESLEALISKKKAIKQGAMQELLTGKRRLPGFAKSDGYKQTEVGVIPEDWEICLVKDFTSSIAGGTPSTLIKEYWDGSVPWMSSGELHHKRIYNVEKKITELGLQESSAHLIPNGCVLIGLAGQGKTRGTVAINEIVLSTNQSIGAILPSSNHNSDYLYHNLDNRYFELRSQSTGDGGRGGLNLRILNNLLIPFPPLPEQKAIAKVLSDMDIEIETLEKKRDKYKQIKQGMMEQLLTGKVRLI